MANAEIRFALALNGGVSLAIWIGGVVDELVRMIDATEGGAAGPYADICGRLRLAPTVDVVTGASAGGLNGVFLGMAIARRQPDLSRLRDLWLNSGSFDRLLRSPIDEELPSLMKGDDYFLERLREALKAMSTGTPREVSTPGSAPLDVRLTATAFQGEQRVLRDRGGDLRSVDHHVEFHFTEADFAFDADASTSTPQAPNGEAIERLARACRSTASFPGAFEPSMVRPEDYGGRVNGITRPEYLIDGGVLVNLPASQAIDAIVAQPAAERVERVLALVVPDPGQKNLVEATGPPDLTAVLSASVVGIPRNQSLQGFLEAAELHNVEVRTRLMARDGLFASLLVDTADPYDSFVTTASTLFRAYAGARWRVSVDNMVWNVQQRLVDSGVAESRWPAPEAVEAAFTTSDVPWLPREFGVPSDGSWCWGRRTVTRSAGFVINVVNALLVNAEEVQAKELRAIKGALSRIRHDAYQFVPEGRLYDKVAEALMVTPNATVAAVIEAALAEWPGGEPQHRQTLNDWVTRLAGHLVETVSHIPNSASESLRGLKRMCSGRTPDQLIQVILGLEVIEVAFAGFEKTVDQEVVLIQITSYQQAPVDNVLRRDASHGKVAGVQLGHFGSFLKRSWRANDWMWGRLDGSTRLVSALAEASKRLKLVTITAENAHAFAKGVEGLTREVQYVILREELPVVAHAIEDDWRDGGTRSGEAAAFVSALRSRAKRADPEPPLSPDLFSNPELEELLALQRVGSEIVADEVGSELATTTSIHAIATAMATLDRASPKLLRGPIKGLRAASFVAWGVTKLTRPRSPVAGLVGMLLGLGAAVAAVDLFTAVQLSVVAPIAWLALGAVAIIAVVRAPMLALPIALIGVVPGLLSTLPENKPEWWDIAVWPHLEPTFAAGGFVVAVLLLGSVRQRAWMSRLRRATASGRAAIADSPTRSTAIAAALALSVAAAATGFKGAALATGSDWVGILRPLATNAYLRTWVPAVIAAVVAALTLKNGRSLLGILAMPLGGPGRVSWRSAVLGVATFGVAGTAMLVDDDWVRGGLVGLAIVLLLMLGLTESKVTGSAGGAADHTVTWTVGPGVLVLLAAAAAAFLRADHVVRADQLLRVGLATALGEEVLFRGGLLSLGRRARNLFVGFLVPALAFGAWHIVDALHTAQGNAAWSGPFSAVFIGATVLAMAGVSLLVLEPLRFRSRSILGPALLHAAVNGSLLVLGFTYVGR